MPVSIYCHVLYAGTMLSAFPRAILPKPYTTSLPDVVFIALLFQMKRFREVIFSYRSHNAWMVEPGLKPKSSWLPVPSRSSRHSAAYS